MKIASGRTKFAVAGLVLVAVAANAAISVRDKYTVKVQGGLAISEFKGYESWEAINISHSGPLMAVILGNKTMIDAYKAGIPENGRPFPDGARMAKIHYTASKNEAAPGQPLVGGALHDVDFMVKDSKRFADGNGWGYAAFKYDPASDTFKPLSTSDTPPQGNDAKCGVACHTAAKDRDYVFTNYGRR
ncbi:cytochrome P460 family protein [Lysobacter sp. A6]|uniref:Cytochrome P460 family protein n=1 Tax=Noviluteimonas lactosilytica TaxID=2888523 RepID=A0ABS8JLI3_9GAMM|nr:cytochrome P460 family protein [Lysobacter lactosilyticus]MCC8364471.1 cytochrome P460 family protein [Lysobacter lactosilyticus]